jgi:DNA invertase Pin-like site-specific DNA recombinase
MKRLRRFRSFDRMCAERFPNESNENQLDILRKFFKDNGFVPPKIFFDEDKTGTDFDRQGFQDMYADAKAGNVDLIVIKDA